jgi:protein involved in polysaccharide export with SLBB domain
MRGVLRSEVRDYLTGAIGKYVKNPQVQIQGSYVRLSILGGVGKPGFYTLPADQLVSDAIMSAGGPVGNIELKKTIVRRNGKDVVPRGEVERAVQEGRSLDQLNVHGGDEIVVAASGGNSGTSGPGGGRGVMGWLWPLQAVVSAVFLLSRVL